MSLPRAILPVLPFLLPYALLVLAFVGFVVWNDGIVLGVHNRPSEALRLTFHGMDIPGDKSNHIPRLHIPQIYYFIAVCTALVFPILLSAPVGTIHLVT